MTTSTITPTRAPGERRTHLSLWPLWLRCLVAAVGMMAGAFSPALLTLIPAGREALSGGRTDPRSSAWTAVAWFVPTVVALALLALLARAQGVRLRSLLAPRGTAELGVGAVVAAAVACVVALTSTVLHAVGAAPGQSASSLSLVVAIALGLERAFLLQGIPEELWFRGFGWGRRGSWPTLLATTLTFTVLHLLSSGGQQGVMDHLTYLLLPLGMAFAAGAVRWSFGSVGGAVGVHGGTHTGLLLASLLGWREGSALWMSLGAVLCVAGAAVLVVRRPWRADMH